MRNARGRWRARTLAAAVALTILAAAACGDDSDDGDALASAATDEMEDMEGDHDHGGGHEATWSPPPSVSVTATEVDEGAFDLRVDVESFTFIDPDAPPEPVDREGHLHVYLDGREVSMLFGPTHRLTEVPPGEHEVRVDLSAADHEPWLIDGEPISATTTVTGPGEAPEADTTIEVTVAGGAVEGGVERHAVGLGDAVAISVTSDQAEEVHVHGYDISSDVGAGGTTTITFTADIPGVFEVELEGSGLQVAELEVS